MLIKKSYVNTINTVGFNVAGQCIQIIQLLIWNNFYAYLFIQVLMMLASNIRISYVVDHFYPTIDFNSTEKVDPKVIQYLKKKYCWNVFCQAWWHSCYWYR